MLTTDSDRDIQAHCCANCVVNLATVVKHPFSCHGSVPNSCAAAVTDDNIVLIQVKSEFHGVGICSWTVENDICTFADCLFPYLQLDSLWWICQRTKPSQCSCHKNKLAKKKKKENKDKINTKMLPSTLTPTTTITTGQQCLAAKFAYNS